MLLLYKEEIESSIVGGVSGARMACSLCIRCQDIMLSMHTIVYHRLGESPKLNVEYFNYLCKQLL